MIGRIGKLGKLGGDSFGATKLKHAFIVEDRARVANRTINFTGTVRNVSTSGGISAAISAASSGDIILLAPGDYSTNAETGGYLIFNTLNKRLLIRAAIPGTVRINHVTDSSFMIRSVKFGEIVFQNIDFTSSNPRSMFYLDGDANQSFCFDNCTLTNTSSSSSARLFMTSDSLANNGYTKTIEFKNTILTKTGTGYTILISNQPETVSYLLTGCTINVSGADGFNIQGGSKCNVAMYDTTVELNSDNYGIALGYDTPFPTYQVGNIDLRSNTVRYLNNHGGHGILFGRGTTKRYAVNNKVFVGAVNNSTYLGIVDKTVSAQLADSVLKGNYVEAPRPYYIKGASYNDVQQNSFISNQAIWEALGYSNYKLSSDEVISRYNRIKNNNFIGKANGIRTYYDAGDSIDVTEAMKTCDIDNNKYYFDGNYLYDSKNSAAISFADRNNFWTPNANDSNSVVVSAKRLPIVY